MPSQQLQPKRKGFFPKYPKSILPALPAAHFRKSRVKSSNNSVDASTPLSTGRSRRQLRSSPPFFFNEPSSQQYNARAIAAERLGSTIRLIYNPCILCPLRRF
jgi:hypothetical protein